MSPLFDGLKRLVSIQEVEYNTDIASSIKKQSVYYDKSCNLSLTCRSLSLAIFIKVFYCHFSWLVCQVLNPIAKVSMRACHHSSADSTTISQKYSHTPQAIICRQTAQQYRRIIPTIAQAQ